MRKRIIAGCILLAAISVPNQAKAEKPIQLGIKGGITIQNLNMNRLKLGDYNLKTDPDVGFQLGLMARINMALFHIQPELNFNFNSYNLDARQPGSNDALNSTVRTTYLEVPVLVGKRILPFLRLNAGPVFNLMSESKYSNSSNNIFSNIRTNKSSISYAVGIGLDVQSVNFDLRYNGEFKRSRQNIAIGDSNADFKTRLNYWSFSLGYFF